MYSLIVVDYNSIEITIEYIKHCKQFLTEAGASHVVIIENGHEENVVASIVRHFGDYQIKNILEIEQTIYCFTKDDQEICYCHSGGNVGFAKGNNLGIKIAEKIWADEFYIVSNNDLVFKKVFDLSVAESLFRNHLNIGVIGPRVATPEGKLQTPRRWQNAFQRLIFNQWVGVIGGVFGRRVRERLYDRLSYDTIMDAESGNCDWIIGCFMIIRAAAFHRAGMFDKNTFLYAEEMILSKRMEAAGYSIYYCKDLEVIHNHAQTTKKALAAFRMVEIDFESNYYFYKTYKHTSPVLLGLAKVSFWLYRTLFKAKQSVKHWLRKAK